MLKRLTEKEKRITEFRGEVSFKNKGKEIARVDMADQEKVKYTTRRGTDVSFRGGIMLNIPQERYNKIFKP